MHLGVLGDKNFGHCKLKNEIFKFFCCNKFWIQKPYSRLVSSQKRPFWRKYFLRDTLWVDHRKLRAGFCFHPWYFWLKASDPRLHPRWAGIRRSRIWAKFEAIICKLQKPPKPTRSLIPWILADKAGMYVNTVISAPSEAAIAIKPAIRALCIFSKSMTDEFSSFGTTIYLFATPDLTWSFLLIPPPFWILRSRLSSSFVKCPFDRRWKLRIAWSLVPPHSN